MRAFRIPVTAIIAALALSGCMRTTGPVAVAPQGDLDSMAYGQPNSPPPQAVAADSGGGAIGAVRAAFAAAPNSAPAPVAYVEPTPVRHDAAYHLDAGDRLRVVVYGQEGLTNTYAIDAGGFSPRARRDSVTVTPPDASGSARFVVPPGSPISPGDTVLVSERWF